MSLSQTEARLIANTEPFRGILRDLIKQIEQMQPVLAAILRAPERHRARVVTRNKQRRNW